MRICIILLLLVMALPAWAHPSAGQAQEKKIETEQVDRHRKKKRAMRARERKVKRAVGSNNSYLLKSRCRWR